MLDKLFENLDSNKTFKQTNRQNQTFKKINLNLKKSYTSNMLDLDLDIFKKTIDYI